MKKGVSLALVVLCLVAAGVASRWLSSDQAGGGGMSAEVALTGIRGVAERFPPPDEPQSWVADLGPKPGQFAESWLFAGLVRDHEDRLLGFQLEISRIAIRLESPHRRSDWAARDVYRARFSVELLGEPVRAGERLSRAALGLAGASGAPAAAWVENWRFTREAGADAFRLEAAHAGASIALRLGFSEHGPVAVDGELHAGHWWPGLRAEGTLALDGREFPVSGAAFLERLWGQALPAGQGQLALARLWVDTADGRALRCQQLRRRAGGGTPLMECQGHPSPAASSRVAANLALAPAEEGWQRVDGARLPLAWTLQRNSDGPPLRLAPLGGERPLSLAAGWSGIVIGADEPAWGLLELSNFATP